MAVAVAADVDPGPVVVARTLRAASGAVSLPGSGGQAVGEDIGADGGAALVDPDPGGTGDGHHVADAVCLQGSPQMGVLAVGFSPVTQEAAMPASSAAAIICSARRGLVANCTVTGCRPAMRCCSACGIVLTARAAPRAAVRQAGLRRPAPRRWQPSHPSRGPSRPGSTRDQDRRRPVGHPAHAAGASWPRAGPRTAQCHHLGDPCPDQRVIKKDDTSAAAVITRSAHTSAVGLSAAH